MDGVHVGSDYFCNNKTCTIHLDNLSRETSGHYRCEVSGDAPEFKLAHDGNNLTIVGEYFEKVRLIMTGGENRRRNIFNSVEFIFQNEIKSERFKTFPASHLEELSLKTKRRKIIL